MLNQVLVYRKWKAKYADELSGDKHFMNLGEESEAFHARFRGSVLGVMSTHTGHDVQTLPDLTVFQVTYFRLTQF